MTRKLTNMDRTLAKTITYRAGSITIELIILFIVTGQIWMASILTISIEGLHTLWYYFHEKVYHVIYPPQYDLLKELRREAKKLNRQIEDRIREHPEEAERWEKIGR